MLVPIETFVFNIPENASSVLFKSLKPIKLAWIQPPLCLVVHNVHSFKNSCGNLSSSLETVCLLIKIDRKIVK